MFSGKDAPLISLVIIMTVSKSEVASMMKNLGLSTITWQTKCGCVSYKPDDRLLKGIHLNNVSPMDITDAGYKRKVAKVQEVVDTFRRLGFEVIFEHDALTCTLGKLVYEFLIVDYPTYSWDVGYDEGYRSEYLKLITKGVGSVCKQTEYKTPDVYHIPVPTDDDFDF